MGDRLTAKAVAALKPAEKDYIKFDAAPVGFGVRVYTNGKKSWVYRYKIDHGPQRQICIGDANSLSLDAARDIAIKNYAMVRSGICPLSESRRQDKTMTVEQLYEDYKENSDLAPVTVKNMDITFNKYILPLVGTRVIGDKGISKTIKDLHAALVREGKPAQANSVARKMKQIFNHAVYREYLPANPIAFKAASEKGFSTTLTLEEAAAVWRACDEFSQNRMWKWWKFGLACQLMIALGNRKGEILYALRWWMVTNDKITIPWEYHKTGKKTKKDLVFYQTDLTRQIFEQLPRTGPLVFDFDGAAISSGNDVRRWHDILKMAGINRRVRLHDIRHTFASIAGNTTTLSVKEVGMLLGHSRTATTDRYLKFFDHTKEEAAKTMAKTMEALFEGQQDDQSSQ